MSIPTALPGLRYAFTITANVDPFRVIGEVEGGELVYVAITGGTVEGEIAGHVLPGGGDWATLVNETMVRVDARYQIETDRGEIIDVHNTGVAHYDDSTRSSVGYFATRPEFRASQARLKHLAETVYVGWAVSNPGATEITIYEVTAPRQAGMA